MTAKRVVVRRQGKADIAEASAYYQLQAGERMAIAFVDAVQRASHRISSRPKTGSPRWGHELKLPALRTWPVRPFPYLIFYIERGDHIDVWRVLHVRRDMAESLEDPGDQTA